jgi:stress-induced morphogen
MKHSFTRKRDDSRNSKKRDGIQTSFALSIPSTTFIGLSSPRDSAAAVCLSLREQKLKWNSKQISHSA